MLKQHLSNWAAGLVCAASLTCCLSSHAADERFFHYRAREGDTLIGLGQAMLRQPADWPVLARLNRIRNPRAIPIGTEIRIPLKLMNTSISQGKILKRVGDVSASPPGAGFSPVGEQAPLTVGSTIKTGADGWVTVALADGSVLRLAPGTEARLERSVRYEGAGFFASTLALIRGRIESLIAHVKGDEPRFEIKTPQAQLGVRGTEFRTTVDNDRGETRSEVLAGSVAVAASNPGRRPTPLVSAGYGTHVTAGQVLPPVPLLPAPDLSQLPTLIERVLIRLRVPPLPGAAAWHGEVARDADFHEVLAESSSTGGELRFANLPDGAYHLRVRGIDVRGLQGRDATSTFKLKARPEPPTPSTPAPQAKLRATDVALSWAQEESAQRYRLQIANQPGFQAPVLDDNQVKGGGLTVPLPPGHYQWRLASIRPDGDQGPWGDPQAFVLMPPPPALPPPQITATTLQFAWAGEPGQAFEFQAAPDRSFAPPQHVLHLTAPQALIDKPRQGGKLYIRYRAIDPDGFIGPFTSPQVIELPLCAQDQQRQCIQTRSAGVLESR